MPRRPECGTPWKGHGAGAQGRAGGARGRGAPRGAPGGAAAVGTCRCASVQAQAVHSPGRTAMWTAACGSFGGGGGWGSGLCTGRKWGPAPSLRVCCGPETLMGLNRGKPTDAGFSPLGVRRFSALGAVPVSAVAEGRPQHPRAARPCAVPRPRRAALPWAALSGGPVWALRFFAVRGRLQVRVVGRRAALAPCPVDGHSGRGDSAAVDSCGLGVLWARRGAPSPAAVRAPGAHAPTALGCPPTTGRGRSGRAARPRFSRSERAWPLASRGPCVWRGLSCRLVLCSVLPSSQRSCVLTPVPPRGFSGGPRSASDRCLCVACAGSRRTRSLSGAWGSLHRVPPRHRLCCPFESPSIVCVLCVRQRGGPDALGPDARARDPAPLRGGCRSGRVSPRLRSQCCSRPERGPKPSGHHRSVPRLGRHSRSHPHGSLLILAFRGGPLL